MILDTVSYLILLITLRGKYKSRYYHSHYGNEEMELEKKHFKGTQLLSCGTKGGFLPYILFSRSFRLSLFWICWEKKLYKNKT